MADARREFSVWRHSASSHPPRSSRFNALRSEPGLTLNTPRDTCSMRRAIPKPCIGSRLRVFRIRVPRVPRVPRVTWMASVFGSPLDIRERDLLQDSPLHIDCQDVKIRWSEVCNGTCVRYACFPLREMSAPYRSHKFGASRRSLSSTGGKDCCPLPYTPSPSNLRFAAEKSFLTKPNTSSTIEMPASLRSEGVRVHPGMPFGFLS
jgi:hypothetical protein